MRILQWQCDAVRLIRLLLAGGQIKALQRDVPDMARGLMWGCCSPAGGLLRGEQGAGDLADALP